MRPLRQGFVPLPVARTLVRLVVRPILYPRLSFPAHRRLLDLASRVGHPAPARTEVCRDTAGGVPAERIRVGPVEPGRAVLYLHGGGYCVGSPTSHRALAAYLSASARAEVWALDYRLAPEHPFPAGLDDAVHAYANLASNGLQVAIAGDSAGGGLAVSTAVSVRDSGAPPPASLLLLSPWADLALTGISLVDKANVDPMLGVRGLRLCAKAYTNGQPADDPRISPLYADPTGLPPTYIQVGSDEILLSDAERLAERLDEAAVPVELRVYEGLWHDFLVHAGMLPAATRAVDEAGRFIRTRFLD